MRLFTAIDLPEDLLHRLERLLSAFRAEALIKWSPVDNLHITTKFIGELPEERLPEIHQKLSQVRARSAFDVKLEGFGFYPDEKRPRVFWCGVDGGDPLTTLASDIEQALLPAGVPQESRHFSAHLTLARIGGPVPLQRLRKTIAELNPALVGTFKASRFCLYQSQPGSNSSQYRKLNEYQFESASAASGN